MRVVIAGASGFLGTHLTSHLRVGGHEVTQLVRREPQTAHESCWDPYAGHLDPAVVARADVVINLAGSKLFGNPHSKSFRRTLHDSRVVTTRVLAEAIAASAATPALIAQNASAWYGDHGADVVTEQSESLGDAFMTHVARDWQEATSPAAEAGSRVCLLRTVPVMHRGSLTMDVLLPVFRLGLGARLGAGDQYFPVISLRDWTGAVSFVAESHDLSGAFNLCSPQAPTNREFTGELAAQLNRKAFLAAPARFLEVTAGPLSPDLLGSFNLRPAALERAGYDFQDVDVREVLATALA